MCGFFPCHAVTMHLNMLIHWGRVTHIFVGNLAINDSDSGLSPGRLQAFIGTNVEILLSGPNKLQWNFNRNSCIFIHESVIETNLCERAAILSRPLMLRHGNSLNRSILCSSRRYLENYTNIWLRLYGLSTHGPLTRYVKLRVVHAPGMPGAFSPPPN